MLNWTIWNRNVYCKKIGLRGGRIGPIRLVSCSHHDLAHVCLFSPERIIQSVLTEQCPTLYLKGARGLGMRVICVKRKGLFNPVRLSFKTKIWFKILFLIRVNWYWIPVSAKANGFPPWFIPYFTSIPWLVAEHRTHEKYKTDMVSFTNIKSNLI